MSDQGFLKHGSYIWDDANNKWVKDTGSTTTVEGLTNVQISGVTPVDGKLPVDTEITVEGNIIVQDVNIHSMPLTEVHISGVTETATGELPVYVSGTTVVHVTDGIDNLAINSDGSINTFSDGIPEYDYKSFSYTNSLVTQIVYKNGGAGGTTVATKTFTYNADDTVATITIT